jgi:glycosyltransferase involved in cell wall biosynthesis
MPPSRIIGCFLVRDEDVFVEQAVRNVADFCDELILIDHRSRDRTPSILARLAEQIAKPIAIHRVDDASRSHAFVQGYAGGDVWVLGVDGDELYDPAGLRLFREQLLGGKFDSWFLVRGNVLHCTALDGHSARGYLAPPATSMTKLYNLQIVERWDGEHPERLGGADGLVFKPGYEFRKRNLYEETVWETAAFRCLHACFLRRSSRERKPGARPSIPDDNQPRRLPARLGRRLSRSVGFPQASSWKLENYRKGPVVTIDPRPFFAGEAPAA